MAHKKLSEVFNQKIFRVPDYQRGYSWEEEHLKAFWNDLENIQEGHAHFFGTLTLEPIDLNKFITLQDATWLCKTQSFEPYFIVDGQQRLATIMVFMQALLDLHPDDEWIGNTRRSSIIEKYLYFTTPDQQKLPLFGYQSDDPSFACWRCQILKLEPYPASPNITQYTHNLVAAREYFIKQLHTKKPSERAGLLDRVQHKLILNEDVLQDEYDVSVAFETMNNRGKELSTLELLKNRLIYLTQLIKRNHSSIEIAASAENLRQKLNQTWRVIYEYLGINPDIKLKDDEYLRNHWIMYFGFEKKEADQLQKSLLNVRFSPEKVHAGTLQWTDIDEYRKSLEISVRHWYELRSAKPNRDRENGEILAAPYEYLSALGYRAFEPLILAAMSRLAKGEPNPNRVTDGNGTNLLAELLKAIEKFVFVSRHICKTNENNKEEGSFRLAKEVYSGVEKVKDAASYVNNWTNRMIGERDAFDDFKSRITKYFNAENDPQGYYSWTGLKYFLFRYEQDLEGEDSFRVGWSDVKHKSIEHIMPQTPGEGWQHLLQDLDERQVHRMIHSLGNLLLLCPKHNGLLGNKEFTEKVKIYSNGSLSEQEIVKEYRDREWNRITIEERGKRLIKYLDETWGLKLIPRDRLYHSRYTELLFP